MKGNRELDELLVSYLLKELNAEKEAFVAECINSDEKVRRQFEELQDSWKLLAIKQEMDKVDINSEWKYFEQAIAKEKQKLISIKNQQVYDEKAVVEVEGMTDVAVTERRYRYKKVLVAFAIAASVFALIALAWNFSTKKEQKQQVAKAVAAPTHSLKALARHEINTSGKSRKIVLQDGSEILLADNSEISYEVPFSNNRRDITLTGRADFKVAKDKTKPFTVYSLDIATTALGTHFMVSAFKKAKNIVVRLYEGKVVVQPVASSTTKLKTDYYLLPGQELIYDNKSITAKLVNFNYKNQLLPEKNKTENFKDDPEIPENRKGSWYMFNNQSLENVFDQLQVIYNVEILYSKKDFKNLYLIGRFDKADSLNSILNRIATLNNFTVTKKNNRFFITKN